MLVLGDAVEDRGKWKARERMIEMKNAMVLDNGIAKSYEASMNARETVREVGHIFMSAAVTTLVVMFPAFLGLAVSAWG